MATLRRDWDALWRRPAPEIRHHLARLTSPTPWLRRVTIEPTEAGGLRAAWFEPPDPARDIVLLYLPGGSYQFGSLETHASWVASLASLANVSALAIEYRLAPEHPHPAALEDALRVWRWLVQHHVEPRHILVAGESAGGNLCLQLMLALRAGSEALPAAAALISPWLDLAATSASYARNADADFGTREMLLAQARAYAGHLSLTDPRISPIHAKLQGLPPLLVQCGSAELLHDECVELAERARAEGVDVALDTLRDMTHAAPLFAELSPEAERGRANIARFLREQACRASG